MAAFKMGRVTVVKALLAQWANPHCTMLDGMTALDVVKGLPGPTHSEIHKLLKRRISAMEKLQRAHHTKATPGR